MVFVNKHYLYIFLWEQSNWDKVWYWGDKLNCLKAEGISNVDVLSYADGKPFILIAGQYDTEYSHEAMLRAKGYEDCPENLKFVNHASGHRPPMWALEKGYDFLDEHLKR